MQKTESIYSISTQSYNKNLVIDYLKKAIQILENEESSLIQNSVKYDFDIEISTTYKF